MVRSSRSGSVRRAVAAVGRKLPSRESLKRWGKAAALSAAITIGTNEGISAINKQPRYDHAIAETRAARENMYALPEVMKRLDLADQKKVQGIIERLEDQLKKNEKLNPTYFKPEQLAEKGKPDLILGLLQPADRATMERIYAEHPKKFNDWAIQYLNNARPKGFGNTTKWMLTNKFAGGLGLFQFAITLYMINLTMKNRRRKYPKSS